MVHVMSAGKQLKVYSLTNQKRKTLSENCAGHFTTSPSHLKLHLHEIFTHLSDFFPYKVLHWTLSLWSVVPVYRWECGMSVCVVFSSCVAADSGVVGDSGHCVCWYVHPCLLLCTPLRVCMNWVV